MVFKIIIAYKKGNEARKDVLVVPERLTMGEFHERIKNLLKNDYNDGLVREVVVSLELDAHTPNTPGRREVLVIDDDKKVRDEIPNRSVVLCHLVRETILI